MRLFLTLLTLVLFTSTARADRPATPEEVKGIHKALQTEGCEGGTYQVHEQNGAVLAYEISEARCPHGVIMNFKLDPAFLVQSMERVD